VRIGLLSDTHIPFPIPKLPRELSKAFRGVDLILHAGDTFTTSVLDELEQIAPVLVASGDEELDDMTGDPRVKYQQNLEFNGLKLQLIHISLRYYISLLRERRHATETRETDAPDIVVFGHDHRTVVKRLDGTLYINPGSPTLLNYLPGLGTVGILTINSGEPHVEIVHL